MVNLSLEMDRPGITDNDHLAQVICCFLMRMTPEYLAQSNAIGVNGKGSIENLVLNYLVIKIVKKRRNLKFVP